MENIRIDKKDWMRKLAKNISAFVRRRYKTLLYYGAMAVVLALIAAAAESYRTDSENARPLVLTENMAQEALADAAEGVIYPENMELIRGFGRRTEWNDSLGQWELHCANDYGFEDGKVVCLAGGTVSDVGESVGRGGFVEIQGDDGRLYRYCSVIPEENILPGAEITAGEVIALADDGIPSETAEGKHLHLEVYENDVLTDFESLPRKKP